MNCPKCDSPKSVVVDSRKHSDRINRRRKCGNCGAMYSTVESVVVKPSSGSAKHKTKEAVLADKWNAIEDLLKN